MSGNQNFDKSTAKHVAGGAKIDQHKMQVSPKDAIKSKPTGAKPVDAENLGKVAGGFALNEQKVKAEVKPIAGKLSPDALKPHK